MKICIIGYFGFDNIGDDAILQYEIRDLKEYINDLSLVVASNGYSDISQREDIKYIPLNLDLIAAENPDVILWGGGWAFYDIQNNQKAFREEGNFLKQVVNKLPNVKIILYGLQIGPVSEVPDLKLLSEVCHLVHGAVVRDKNSENILNNAGIPLTKTILTADIGYEVSDAHQDTYSILKEYDIASPYIALSFSGRLLKYENILTTLETVLVEQPFKLLYLPAQVPGDVGIFENLKLLNKNIVQLKTEHHTPEIIHSLLSKAIFAITNRLHIAILGSTSGTPVVGFDTESKMDFFYKDIDAKWLHITNMPDIDPKMLNHIIDRIGSDQGLRNNIRKKSLVKRELAKKSRTGLLDLLEGA